MTAYIAPPRAGKREWAALAVLALPALFVSFDMFVLLLALPQLTADLGATSTEQLWIMDVYGFMVGGFLITMGSLGDKIGRRKLLMIGAAAFAAASILAAYSTSPEMLIAARALLGIAGATLGPSTLSLISNIFRDPKQMGMALGIWAGSFTLGGIIGPVIGGAMMHSFWWGSVFLLGVPVMVLLLIAGPVLLPEYSSPQGGRVDLISALLSLGAILAAIFGLKELARGGWEMLPAAAVLAGLALGVLFIRRQQRLADPMLDMSLFKNKDFSTSLLSLFLYASLTAATLLFITQYLQSVAQLTPLQAGLAMIPGLAVGTISVTYSPILGRKFKPANVISIGLLVTAAGLAYLAQIGPESGSLGVIIGFALWCLGGGPLLTLGMNLVMASVPPEKMGSASALPQVSNELGAALGVAVIGTVGTLVYRLHVDDGIPAGLPSEVSGVAGESVAGATAVAGSMPVETGSALLNAAREAFVSGMNWVAGIAAVILAGSALFVARRLRHIPPVGAPAPEECDASPDEMATGTQPAGTKQPLATDVPQEAAL